MRLQDEKLLAEDACDPDDSVLTRTHALASSIQKVLPLPGSESTAALPPIF